MPNYNDSDIICHCLSIKRCEVIPLIVDNKNFNLNNFISQSGAGSVCTGCHLLLREISGDCVWTPVTVSAITQLTGNVKSFRFESNGDAFLPAKAGQHILVQAYIEGRWESRRYTLTSPCHEVGYREITVKQKHNGRFSSWLHQISMTEQFIRISQPAGEVIPDLVSTRPLICLVAGIGITPVISFVRLIQFESRTTRQLVVDYSELNETSLVCKDEICSINNISINFRLTQKDGHISQNNINELAEKYPDSEYYICGPEGYLQSVIKFLINNDVDRKRISTELFTTTDVKKVVLSKYYIYQGLVLFFAFLAQEIWELKIPWLENLQMQDEYKIYSGLFLALYVLSQFVMAYNKSCEKPHVSAIAYRQHKFRGSLAPLVFFIHSTQFGSAYLLFLSIVYFSNFLLGIVNHELFKDAIKRVKYFNIWLPAHITLSLVLVSLIVFHVYVVSSY